MKVEIEVTIKPFIVPNFVIAESLPCSRADGYKVEDTQGILEVNNERRMGTMSTKLIELTCDRCDACIGFCTVSPMHPEIYCISCGNEIYDMVEMPEGI